MPRPKPLSEYPPEYFALLQRASESDSVSVRTESPAAARLLRAHLYTFRRVLREHDLPDNLEAIDDLAFVIAGSELVIVKKRPVGVLEISEALDAKVN